LSGIELTTDKSAARQSAVVKKQFAATAEQATSQPILINTVVPICYCNSIASRRSINELPLST
jgi:hypothetical protein